MNTINHSLFRVAFLACALVSVSGAWANSNFVTNPYLPYPPSCARMPAIYNIEAAEFGAMLAWEGVIQLPDLNTFEQVDFVLRAYRSPCHEAGRSLVWLEYSLTAEQARKDIRVRLPDLVASYQSNAPGAYWSYDGLLVHASEPSSWGVRGFSDTELLLTQPHGAATFSSDFYNYFQQGRSWWFLVDNESPILPTWEFHPAFAEAYNARFYLMFRYDDQQLQAFYIPAAAEMSFQEHGEFPFTGRLSGNWVIEDARDQGFMLAISGLVKQPEPNYTGFVETYFDYPTSEMVLFYSHYTFDAEGRMLWLTGSATFNPGTHQLSIPIDEVSQGEFRSSKPAQRRSAGQVTLTANNCNDITLDYDFSKLGLGTGSKRLQRLFSLETAGYDCRDYDARVQANK